jgi:2,3-diaminopropionate biosynthesis protein SbnB
MRDCDLLAIGNRDVMETLAGHELEIIHSVRIAYQAHAKRKSALPHSTFLRFPGSPANRIIALPAYLGEPVNSAGVKWIASFPENLELGLDRASATVILNSMSTGRPKAIMEGSIISAKRTAASAALAAQVLDQENSSVAGIIGCGLINLEIVRFLRLACPRISTLLVYDLNAERAETFRNECETLFGTIQVRVAPDVRIVLCGATLISFATTAAKPHVDNLDCCVPGTVILHVSLRDLFPKVILSSDNIVDDVDHVCRAETSIHLTEQQTGDRSFVRCALADILNGDAVPRRDPDKLVIFSPFGLGILDIALGEYVYQECLRKGKGHVIPSFLPPSWNRTRQRAA